MNKKESIAYKIIFNEEAPYEYRYKILETIIQLYNEGCSNLGVVAELNLSVCQRNDELGTAKFVYVGM